MDIHLKFQGWVRIRVIESVCHQGPYEVNVFWSESDILTKNLHFYPAFTDFYGLYMEFLLWVLWTLFLRYVRTPPVTFICEFFILSPVSERFVYAVVKPVARAQHKDQEPGHSHPSVGAEGARHAWVNIGSNGKQRAFRGWGWSLRHPPRLLNMPSEPLRSVFTLIRTKILMPQKYFKNSIRLTRYSVTPVTPVCHVMKTSATTVPKTLLC